jgi:hypothetical protein
MDGYATPEEAVRAADGIPPEYARIVAVDYSPDQRHAILLIEYNEPPVTEPYVVLCERRPDGWHQLQGGSGGGLSWLSTSDDGTAGVEVAWGQQPRIRWDVPSWYEREPPRGPNRW